MTVQVLLKLFLVAVAQEVWRIFQSMADHSDFSLNKL